MKKIIYFIFTIHCLLLCSCKYDNFDAPQSMFTGKAVYEGKAVSVRSGSSEFALFQDGYALHGSIPVYIDQDGSFSVCLFDGEYKLVRVGNAPWERPNNDTILVTVKGNTVQDIPVIPYFMINNESFSKKGNKIVASFNINKIVDNANLEDVHIYLGKGVLTDNNQKEADKGFGSTLSLNDKNTVDIDIPESLINEEYIFVRVGIKSDKSSEYCYTQSTKVRLK